MDDTGAVSYTHLDVYKRQMSYTDLSNNTYLGKGSLKVNKQNSELTALFGAQQTITLPEGTYTFSSYVKSNQVPSYGGTTALAAVKVGSKIYKSENISSATTYGGWYRLSVTFKLDLSLIHI